MEKTFCGAKLEELLETNGVESAAHCNQIAIATGNISKGLQECTRTSTEHHLFFSEPPQ